MPDEPSPEKMPGALQASRKTAEMPVPRYGRARTGGEASGLEEIRPGPGEACAL